MSYDWLSLLQLIIALVNLAQGSQKEINLQRQRKWRKKERKEDIRTRSLEDNAIDCPRYFPPTHSLNRWAENGVGDSVVGPYEIMLIIMIQGWAVYCYRLSREREGEGNGQIILHCGGWFDRLCVCYANYHPHVSKLHSVVGKFRTITQLDVVFRGCSSFAQLRYKSPGIKYAKYAEERWPMLRVQK